MHIAFLTVLFVSEIIGEGGVYRIVFGYDAGYSQYHPEENSHHKTAYYKTSSGRLVQPVII